MTAIDLYTQALKALTERCPFDSDEVASRSLTLPFRFARHYSKNKFKKHGEVPGADVAAAKQSKSSGMWDEMESYFRAIDESDIEFLRKRRLDESLFSIPRRKGSNDSIFSEVEVENDSNISNVTSESIKEEIKEEKVEEEKSLSISWVLGSKHRAILASERPNKKRKLLGRDAGLDQLLALNDNKESKGVCDVCCLGDSGEKGNMIVSCMLCNVSVHKKCYGISEEAVDGPFLCGWCKQLDGKTSMKPCLLCPKESGALKLVGGNEKIDGKFVHLFCGMWTPEVYVDDVGKMEPVLNVGGVEEKRMGMVCTLCRVKHGACVRCSYGTCRAAFHPICARDARHRMEIWGKFGCDNVELRVFCSKHSTSHDVCSARCTNNITQSTGDDISVAKTNKLIKLKLSCNGKEESKIQSDENNPVPKEVVKNEAAFEQDALVIHPGIENGGILSCKNMDIAVAENDSTSRDISNHILFVKKLIGRGKIVVRDVASEIGISSDSLEAALMGEISSFPVELRVKVTKWFQKSIYKPISMQQMKIRNGYSISALTNTINLDIPDTINLDIPGNSKLANPNDTDNSVKLLTSHTDEDKTVNSSEEQDQRSSKGELVNECTQVPVFYTDDRKQNSKDQGCFEMITEESCIFPRLCPQALPPEVEGHLATLEKEWLETHNQTQCIIEIVPSKNNDSSQALEANIPLDISFKKERIDGSCSGSYIHPYIQKRLDLLQGMHVEHERRELISNGQSETEMPSTKSDDSCNHLSPSPVLDQLVEAKQMGVMEHSPEDEVEGEILHQQNKLLNNTFAIKRGFEILLGRVVKKLPQEIDALKKQEWDLVHVNQFLCEVNDAKKRGRKGRKRREVQAVAGEDPAVASTSSRDPLQTKDRNNVTGSPNLEIPQTALSGRTTRGLRLKETERSSIVKISHPDVSKENSLCCDICSRSETLLNRIFVCSSCKVAVHLDCYCKLTDPIGPWKCNMCAEMLESGSPRSHLVTECGLCGGDTGAFRKAANGQWVHAFCAEWLLESSYRRGQQNLIEGMDFVSKEKDLLTCSVCQQKSGVCSKCSYEHCQTAFHPTCARAAGFYMNVRIIGGRFHHKAYCEKHSMELKQKADDQQYGLEELKSIKQMRFELEKLRILCERIVRREKIKKDLVLCSHGILASKKDYVAYAIPIRKPVRKPICMSGISSESATTSVDNKSYSGTLQRSEDVTMESTISSKSRSRVSFETDGRNDDGSTSRPSLKRKIGDRTSCSGKQLPHRIQFVSFQYSEDDGEKRFKAKKNMETFNKEILMTSHQALMHNKRLPKGFVYVPIDSLSKEKPLTHGSPSQEPEEPGG